MKDFEQDFELGKRDAREGRFSAEAMALLAENLQSGDLNWLDTEDGELAEAVQELSHRLGEPLSDEFIRAYWGGVFSVWEAIGTHP